MGEIRGEVQRKETEHPKRKILEIGIGFRPYYKHLVKEDEELTENDQYIGFDITEKRLKFLKDNADIKLVIGDGIKLPFTDESMDEVVLPDILNAIVVTENESILEEGILKRRSYDDINRKNDYFKNNSVDDLKNTLIQIIEESVRVLKPAGVLKIIQRLSIENDVRGRLPFDEVLEYINKHDKLQNWHRELRPEPRTDYPRKGHEMLIITVTKK